MHGTHPGRRPQGTSLHFLLSVVIARNVWMHAYLACTDKHRAFDTGEWLAAEAEKTGSTHPLRSTILITPLDDDAAATVRQIAGTRSAEVREALKTVADQQLA